MIVSIDFDDTWTKDPEAWRAFARTMHGRGHVVIVTTNRYDLPIVAREVFETVATSSVRDVIFAGAKPKRAAARERGYEVDVWIDDRPEMVIWGRSHPLAHHCVCRTWPTPSRHPGHHPGCPQARGVVVG